MKKVLVLFIFVFTFSLFAEESNTTEMNNNENKTQEKKKSGKKLKISARIQSRIVTGEEDSDFAKRDNFDTVDFNFRRIRLGAKFQGASWYGGVVDLKGENMLTSGEKSKSGIQEANLWLRAPLSGKLKMGQFKIPFIREQMSSSGKMITNEKAFSTETLQQQDIGLLYAFKPLCLLGKSYKEKLNLAFSVTNGDGGGSDGVGRKEVEATNKYNSALYNWRVQFNPFGGIIKGGKDKGWQEGNEIFQKRTKLSLGYGGAYTEDQEYDSDYIPANGGTLFANTVDMTFTTHFFYLGGAYTIFSGSSVADDLMSYQFTVGYNLKIGKLWFMPVVRYDYIQADANSNSKIDDGESKNNLWLGLNLFADKHNLKAQAFYQIRTEKNSKGIDTKKDNVFYLQVTANFSQEIK